MSVSILKEHQQIHTWLWRGWVHFHVWKQWWQRQENLPVPKLPKPLTESALLERRRPVWLKTSELKESESIKLQAKKALFGRCFCASKIHWLWRKCTEAERGQWLVCREAGLTYVIWLGVNKRVWVISSTFLVYQICQKRREGKLRPAGAAFIDSVECLVCPSCRTQGCPVSCDRVWKIPLCLPEFNPSVLMPCWHGTSIAEGNHKIHVHWHASLASSSTCKNKASREMLFWCWLSLSLGDILGKGFFFAF